MPATGNTHTGPSSQRRGVGGGSPGLPRMALLMRACWRGRL